MQYHLAPLFCRPWTLNGISPRLIESETSAALASLCAPTVRGGSCRRGTSIIDRSRGGPRATDAGNAAGGLPRRYLASGIRHFRDGRGDCMARCKPRSDW